MKNVQCMLQPSFHTIVQSDVKIDHLDDVSKLEKTDPNSSLLALASLSIELLKDANETKISVSAQDISPKEHIPTIDMDLPSREMSPPRHSK